MSNLYVDKTILADGSAADPAIKFANDPNSGLYRISEDKIGIATGGVRVGEIGAGYGGFTGNVIQVSFGSKSGSVSTTTSGYADSLLNLSITPKYNNSKILIFGNVQGAWNSGGNGGIRSRLTRNGTSIYIITNLLQYDINSITFRNNSFSFSYLDSPASTSALTYKIEFGVYNVGTAILHDWGDTQVLSTITAMEIQQ